MCHGKEVSPPSGNLQWQLATCSGNLQLEVASWWGCSREYLSIHAEVHCHQPVMLSCCSVHPLGGTAYLSLESSEEPFAGGIKFTAMPPTKRFRDMEQLSGGEKVRADPRHACIQPASRPGPGPASPCLPIPGQQLLMRPSRACSRMQPGSLVACIGALPSEGCQRFREASRGTYTPHLHALTARDAAACGRADRGRAGAAVRCAQLPPLTLLRAGRDRRRARRHQRRARRRVHPSQGACGSSCSVTAPCSSMRIRTGAQQGMVPCLPVYMPCCRVLHGLGNLKLPGLLHAFLCQGLTVCSSCSAGQPVHASGRSGGHRSPTMLPCSGCGTSMLVAQTSAARVVPIAVQTRPGGEHARFQSIVISLKDNFFEKADGLVGIARDCSQHCSSTFTFDLTRFDTG